jgi:hypothetical protein
VRRNDRVHGEERVDDKAGRSPGRAATIGAATGLPAGRGDIQGARVSPRTSGGAESAIRYPGRSRFAQGMGGEWPSPGQAFRQGWVQATTGNHPHEEHFFQAGGGDWGDTGAGHPLTSTSDRAARASGTVT